MSDNDLSQRLAAVERLTALYRPERTVHLIVTTVSLLILLAAAGMMLYRGQAGVTELGLMFGASGMVSYTAAQLLKMWDRSVSLVASSKGVSSDNQE